jgi:hypothetical protein
MTLNVAVPDTVYRRIAELVARHLPVERIVAVAYAGQLPGWTRAAQMTLPPRKTGSRSGARERPAAVAGRGKAGSGSMLA